MKKSSLLILSAIVLQLASCGNKSDKTGLSVPKDAALVVHINSASLSSKLSWSEIKATTWFKKMHEEAPTEDSLAQKLMDDPSISGIDTKSDFVMFMKKQGRGGYMVVEGSLTNQATYEQMLAEMHKKQPREIKKHGDFSYITPDDNSVVLWNKAKFAMVTNVPMGDMGVMGKSFYGGGGGGGYEFETDSLRLFGEQALTVEGGQNLDSDSRFADLVKDGSDMHVWFDLGKFMPTKGNAMLSMMKVNTLLEDNVTAMSVNFDNGKISAKSKHYYNDDLARIYEKNKPGNVTADVINRIPATDVLGVCAFNFSPAALKDVIKLTGLDAMADMVLAKADFSIDDFVKATDGGFLLAVSDPEVRMDTMNFGGMTRTFPSKPKVKILAAVSVKDKATFEKLVTTVWDMSKKYRKSEDDNSMKPEVSYKLANNWFAISNSEEYTNKFLAGGSNNKFPFTDKITGHPIGMYVDLQRILKFVGTMAKEDNASKQAIDASLNMWQDITAKGGDLKNKSAEFEFEINLVDKNTNSLKQLNQYLDKMSSLIVERNKKVAIKEVTIEDIRSEEGSKMPPPPPPAKK